MTFTCKHCGEQFETERHGKKYCNNRCAVLAAGKRYRKRHPERYRETKRLYRERNRERCNERQRNWYARNPDKAKRIARRRYEKHRESILQRSKEWWQNNPDRAKELSREWRRKNPYRIQVCTMPLNPNGTRAKNRRLRAEKRQRWHLSRTFGTCTVQDESKKLAAIIFLGNSLSRDEVKPNRVKSLLYRIEKGETYAAYE